MSTRVSTGLVPARNRATWLLALAYVAAYLVLDWASYIRPLQGLNITPWNPQPALAIALLIWSRRWIWLVWAALVAAELVVRGVPVNWLGALTATVALSLTYAAIAQALAQRIDLSHPFATLKDLAWFAAIVIGGSLVSAVLYVLAFSAGGFGPEGSIYGAIARYWVGDAVGLVVTLPILLIWMDRASRASACLHAQERPVVDDCGADLRLPVGRIWKGGAGLLQVLLPAAAAGRLGVGAVWRGRRRAVLGRHPARPDRGGATGAAP